MVKGPSLLSFFLLLLAIFSAGPLAAQNVGGQPKISSAFTDLSKECKNAFKTVGEGQDMPL